MPTATHDQTTMWDLFIEMDTMRRPPERAIEVSEIFGLRPWSRNVVVYTAEEVYRLSHVNGTLLLVIEKDGKVLYQRPGNTSS